MRILRHLLWLFLCLTICTALGAIAGYYYVEIVFMSPNLGHLWAGDGIGIFIFPQLGAFFGFSIGVVISFVVANWWEKRHPDDSSEDDLVL